MKNRYFTLLFLSILYSYAAKAQFSKGDIAIGILAAPLPTVDSNVDDLGLIVKGNIEFFISNRWSLSTSAYISNNATFKNDSGIERNSYGIIPTAQYYVLNGSKFSLFGQVGYGYGFEDRTVGNAQNSALTIWNVGLGSQYRITTKWHIKLLLPYFKAQNITFDSPAADGFGPFVGFNYVF